MLRGRPRDGQGGQFGRGARASAAACPVGGHVERYCHGFVRTVDRERSMSGVLFRIVDSDREPLVKGATILSAERFVRHRGQQRVSEPQALAVSLHRSRLR